MNTIYEATGSTSFPWIACLIFGAAVAAIFVLALRKWKEKSKSDKLIVIIPIVLLIIYGFMALLKHNTSRFIRYVY